MTFKQKVKQIAHAERDVDKVLKAARLQRTPKKGFDEDYLFGIIIVGMFMLFFLASFLIMRGC